MTEGYLIASLIWGTLGFGIFLYGKKSQQLPPMLGGLAMMGLSYFTGPLLMSVLSVLIILGLIQAKRLGH